MIGPQITIHTDGSCPGNPGPGGYAAVLRRYDEEGNEIKTRHITGGAEATTNIRMEMTVAIKGLRQIRSNETARITIFADCQTLIKGMNEWLPRWQAKSWRNATGKEVANKDLWLELISVSKGLEIRWEWVRGHNGDPHNEEADRLAYAAALKRA